MAAPSGITWGSVVNNGESNAARIGIHTSLSNNIDTSVTVNVEVWLWTRYAVDDLSNQVYFDWSTTSATTLVNSNVDIFTTNSEWSTYNQVQLFKTSKSYAKGINDTTDKCASKVSGIDFIGTTLSLSKSFQVPSRTKYTISFNSNGGYGAPSSQTKTYGYDLTLSSTKPSRTGYTFLGWSTSSSATSATYSAGGTYKNNSSTTLYAVWEVNTYTITYNGNGGSGVPSMQTKTYGVNLRLSTTIPTRSGYKFLGWSTEQTSKTPTYLRGDTFTSNINTTLYAIWEQLGIAYVNVNGTFQPGKVWVNNYGTWEIGIIFVNDYGTWTQGGI